MIAVRDHQEGKGGVDVQLRKRELGREVEKVRKHLRRQQGS